MAYLGDPKPSLESLSHHGVKGMKWGVRKDDGGLHRLQSSDINVDPSIHKSTRDATIEVSKLMSDRYGYNIKNAKVIGPDHPEYPSTIAYVESKQVHGAHNSGTIFIQGGDLGGKLKQNEQNGWFSPGTGNVKGLLTHESAHSLFHADQVVKNGVFGQKIKGGVASKARDKALKAAMKAAMKDGRSILETSGYAYTARSIEELEAELFNNYHWGTNPPRFVNEWGKTLHREMGIDPTPFKEVT